MQNKPKQSRQEAKEQRNAEERLQRLALRILCVECFQLCYIGLDDKWKCHNERHNQMDIQD